MHAVILKDRQTKKRSDQVNFLTGKVLDLRVGLSREALFKHEGFIGTSEEKLTWSFFGNIFSAMGLNFSEES